MPRNKLIKPRRATLAQWATAEASGPALADGEMAWISDEKSWVVGDGVTKVASLPRSGTSTYATISSLSSYGHILGEAHSSATVVNTASEGTLATFAIPTNASIGDVYNFVASGDLLNNSGSPVTYQWKFSIGSTAALLGQANSISSSAQRRRWVFRACIRVTGASTQNVSGELFISTAMSASFSDGSISAIGSGSSSEDLSTEKQAKFSVIMGTASASADVVCAGAHLVMPGKAI